MATSVVKSLNGKLMPLIKTKTVTATTDSNGFLVTDLNVEHNALIGVRTLKIDNVDHFAYFAEFLYNSGDSAQQIAIRFKSYGDIVIAVNATVTVTVVYVEF